MSTRKHVREVIAFAKGIGIQNAAVVYRGRHPQVRGTAPGGRAVRVTFSWTPRDQDLARRKIEADLRKAVRT